jgi:hypothetical protein
MKGGVNKPHRRSNKCCSFFFLYFEEVTNKNVIHFNYIHILSISIFTVVENLLVATGNMLNTQCLATFAPSCMYLFILHNICGPGYSLSTSWTVRGSNPGGGEIFSSRPDRPWGPPSLLYNRYQVSFPWVKRPGRGVDHPPSSSARVKERVELYLYSPSEPSWPVVGRTLPFTT